MPTMWSDAAKKSAEEEYGRRNYRWLALGRSLPRLLMAVAAAGFVWLAVVGGQAASGMVEAKPSFNPWPVLVGAVVVAAVVVLVIRRARRPYRMPRRGLLRRRY